MTIIRTILFPTDFLDSSAFAWKHALLHASKQKSRIVVVHVVRRMPPGYQFLVVAMTPAQIYGGRRERAEQQMARLAIDAESKGVTCEVLVRDGQPFVQIIRCAREVKADLIVMGSHGRSGLAQMLIGSVAEKVVRKAPCSVVVVKHPTHHFRMP